MERLRPFFVAKKVLDSRFVKAVPSAPHFPVFPVFRTHFFGGVDGA